MANNINISMDRLKWQHDIIYIRINEDTYAMHLNDDRTIREDDRGALQETLRSYYQVPNREVLLAMGLIQVNIKNMMPKKKK